MGKDPALKWFSKLIINFIIDIFFLNLAQVAVGKDSRIGMIVYLMGLLCNTIFFIYLVMTVGQVFKRPGD